MQVKIINKSKHSLPHYATLGASGMDLRANISENITLKPLERYLVPTGIFIQLPKGYEGQIRPRSGLSVKKGITLANSVGTIDSDYIGEIRLGMINLSNEDFIIEDGERLAQLIVAQYTKVEWLEVAVLDETARGENGFGSTGEK